MITQLHTDAAQYKQPEHDHEGQVEAAECRGVQQRKSEIERAAPGKQPDLITVPNRTDRAQRRLSFSFGAGQEQERFHDLPQVVGLGVDLGQVALATDSDGARFSGGKVKGTVMFVGMSV